MARRRYWTKRFIRRNLRRFEYIENQAVANCLAALCNKRFWIRNFSIAEISKFSQHKRDYE